MTSDEAQDSSQIRCLACPGVSKGSATAHEKIIKFIGDAGSLEKLMADESWASTPLYETEAPAAKTTKIVDDPTQEVGVQSMSMEDLSACGVFAVILSNLKEFYDCLKASDRDQTGLFVADDLFRILAEAAQSVFGQPSTDDEVCRQVSETARFFLRKIGRFGQNKVSIALWMHHALLMKGDLPTPVQVPVEDKAEEATSPTLVRIAESWLEADVDCHGWLPRDKFLKASTDPPSTELLDIFVDQELVATQTRLPYTAFCASELEMTPEPVDMYFYDLAKGATRVAGVEGVWHTSIVVFGTEVYVLGDVRVCGPKASEFGKPKKSMRLGYTLQSEQSFFSHVETQLSPEFRSETYDLVEHNCNHFCDRASEFLLGRHIPAKVRDQSKIILDSVHGCTYSCGRKLLTYWLKRSRERSLKKAAKKKELAGNRASLSLDDVQSELRARRQAGQQRTMRSTVKQVASNDTHSGWSEHSSVESGRPDM